MINVSLVFMPGQGLVATSLREGTTIAGVLATYPDVLNRQVVLNGREVNSSSFASTVLRAGDELGLVGNSKGA